MNDLRSLPSVEQLLQSTGGSIWLAEYGRPLTLQAIRGVLEEVRKQHSTSAMVPTWPEIEARVTDSLSELSRITLVPLINASGVILHTNLGRAPLSQAALNAVQAVASGYSNLEYDLQGGSRGSRLSHAEEQFKQLTGAEAALVVNNNAAAVLLILTTLAKRRRVVIARSQLIEIGGGFRLPDVMKQSGARLVEVGTTNRVHLSDYSQAIELENPVMVLHAHRSNFQIVGFTSEPELADIVKVSHQAGIPVVDDLGSGTLIDTRQFGLGHEPTILESLQCGVDLVCFSGDKLLGGPQAGIIIGRGEYVERLKKHPLARAIRADKLCLAALSATLGHYQRDQAIEHIPVWQMIAMKSDSLRYRAQCWADAVNQGEVVPGESTIGGGSLPGETLPTYHLALKVPKPTQFATTLRSNTPPIIARVEDNRVLLDPRTVLPEQEPILVKSIQRALAAS
jgi:L-seryl-tRNA(Ser) seleniumtransferase